MENDLIRRQDALDALGEEPLVWYGGEDEIAERNQWRRDVKAIEGVPSAQPDIIRCKDCVLTDGYGPIADGRYWCMLHGAYMHYCSAAERRTNG